jgi:hypothetical protein
MERESDAGREERVSFGRSGISARATVAHGCVLQGCLSKLTDSARVERSLI